MNANPDLSNCLGILHLLTVSGIEKNDRDLGKNPEDIKCVSIWYSVDKMNNVNTGVAVWEIPQINSFLNYTCALSHRGKGKTIGIVLY